MMTGAELIPKQLLKRKAVVYVRQSTQSQVMTNLESQRRQYDLVNIARQHGFDPNTLYFPRCVGAIMQAWRPFEQVNSRFDKVDSRFDKMDTRLSGLETSDKDIQGKLSQILNKLG